MSKLLGRIPAHRVHDATKWKLPEVIPDDETQKVFKLGLGSAVERKNSRQRSHPEPLPAGEEKAANGDSSISESSPETPPEEMMASETGEPAPKNEADNLGLGGDATGDQQLSGAEADEPASGEGQSDSHAESEARGFAEGEACGFKQGESEGREQGRREAQAAFAQEVKAKWQLLEKLASAFAQPPDQSQMLKDRLVHLVSNIAEVVILSELQLNPGHIKNLVDKALEAIPPGLSNIRVAVNPTELSWLKESGTGFAADVEYVADQNLAIGGCKISSEKSEVDGTLGKRIHDCLIKVFNGEKPKPPTESDLLQTASEMHDD